LRYFPDALAGVAGHSYKSNAKHNPGEPLHWAQAKSADEADALLRHLADLAAGVVSWVEDGVEYSTYDAIAWRALALSQRAKDAHAAQESLRAAHATYQPVRTDL